MKDIVIIANFCRDFSETDNGRFMYLCKELSKDNKVEIITSDFSHGSKKYKDAPTVKWPFTITFLHEPGYIKNISVKRFLSHRVWGKNVGKYLARREKPDVIYCAMPSLTAAKKTAEYCEKNGIKFIIDIQDLWPEAFKMVLNIPMVSDVIFYPFNRRANRAYCKADAIIGVSETYVNRALSVNKKCTEAHSVFLGTKLEIFDTNVSTNPAILQKNADDLWVAYIGTLGASYDITCVIRALKILKEQGCRVPKFIVMGDGERRSEFENEAKACGLDTVFTGRLPYQQMCALLAICDIAVNPITHGAAQSIINKHGDYAAAGLPVINTQECPEYRGLVENYRMGYNCENGNEEDVANKLKALIDNPVLREEMGKNARRCAEEKFDRQNSYEVIISAILA